MRFQTALARRLGLLHPVIQAPMAGGTSTVDLVVAVCEAGALGSIGAAYSTPEQIAETARQVRARTSRPFGINLFASTRPPERPRGPAAVLERLAPFHAELGLPPPVEPQYTGDPFPKQLEAVLQSGASVFSFTFGIPPPQAIEAIKARGMFVAGTATTVEEARALESAGVDAVVAQGSEAGAHRGTFAAEFESAMVGTMALVPQVVDAVRVPVIASGGIMDGRGVVAALALGASAAQMGTAFLMCDESGAPDAHKEAILSAHEDQTRLTRAFSGRAGRSIVNRFVTEIERGGAGEAILPYPLQNSLTRPLRTEAAKQGRAEFLSLWAGQGVRLARRQSASALIGRVADEAEAIVRRLVDDRRAAGS